MIRLIEEKDLEKVVNLVYKLNNTDKFYSGYCSKLKSNIKEEVKVSIKEKNALVYEEKNDILGILLYFDAPSGDYDLSGPFVKNEDLTIGKELLARFFKEHHNLPVNFFFTKKSTYYLNLMEDFNLNFSGYEYILKLSREDFKNTGSPFSIRKPHRKELPLIQDMHEEIFGECYVTKEMLGEVNRFNQILLLELDHTIAGFALLLIYEDHTYLELFGLLKDFRGKGLSKSFLSKILEKAFEEETKEYCMLVVDKINTTANKVYKDLGFRIIEENVSYKKQ